MYNLYGIDTRRQSILLVPPETNTNYGILENNIEKMFNWHHRTRDFVRSNHPLVTYLETMSVIKSKPFNEYRSEIIERALIHSKAMKWTSELSIGKVHRDFFFGQNSQEVIIAKSTYECLKLTRNNWKDFAAIQVIRHPLSHLTYDLREYAMHNSSGPVVILIDVNILACQYYLFLQEQTRKMAMFGVEPLRTTNFIKMYVEPHILDSCIAVTGFNIHYNTLFNYDMTESKGAPSGAVYVNNTKFYRKTAKTTVISHMKSSRSILDILNNSSIKHGAMPLEFTEDVYINKQNSWAYLLGTLPYINYAMTIRDHHRGMNHRQYTKIFKRLRDIETDHVFLNSNIDSIKMHYDLDANNIKSLMDMS